MQKLLKRKNMNNKTMIKKSANNNSMVRATRYKFIVLCESL